MFQLRITLVLILTIFSTSLFANDCQKNWRHANTFYWVALEESGNGHYLNKSREYLNKAKSACKSELMLGKISSLYTELDNQVDMAHDTLTGVYPLTQFLTREVGESHANMQTYLFLDPDTNFHAMNLGLDTTVAAIRKFGKNPNTKVFVNSYAFESDEPGGRDKSIESEVTYSLNKLGDFFVTSDNEIIEKLNSENQKSFYRNELTNDLLDEIKEKFDTNTVLFINARHVDHVENTHMFEIQSKIYDLNEKQAIKEFYSYGFAHDQTFVVSEITFWAAILFLISLAVSFSDKWKVTNKLIGHNHFHQFLITSLFFALGYVIPNDIILPAITSFAPDLDAHIGTTWWWPLFAFVACTVVTPGIVRGITSTILVKLKTITFKLYDDKNYVVVGLGNTLSFYSIYLNYNQKPSLSMVVAIGFALSFTYALMGRYMQSTKSSQYVILGATLVGVSLSGLGFTQDSILFLGASAAISGSLLLLVLYLESKDSESFRTCDLTKEESFQVLNNSLSMIQPNFDGELKLHFDGETVNKIVEGLKDSSQRWINIQGDSGSGKSLIAHDAINQYVEQKTGKTPFVLIADSKPSDDGNPLSVFRRALKQLPDDLYNTAGQEDKDGLILQGLNIISGDFFDFETKNGEYENRKIEIFNALILAAQEREVILVIEDCHHFDDDVKRFLPELVENFIEGKCKETSSIMKKITFVFCSRSMNELLNHRKGLDIEISMPQEIDVRSFLSKMVGLNESSVSKFLEEFGHTKSFSWKKIVTSLSVLAYNGRLVLEDDSVHLLDPPKEVAEATKEAA
ncbi:MAG: ATP-binding protein [Bacteriovoracaceae bacterium]|nr:ATP-binding protein [Bacteriovoracaceae bacterium]